MAISFIPKSTEFSINNAKSLAQCAAMAYQNPQRIALDLASEGYTQTKFIDIPANGTQLFVAANDSAIVLSFRGTEPNRIKDWLVDTKIGLSPFAEGKVHTGFHQALDSVWSEIVVTISAMQKKAQPLWITGHSLGGALATLAAARFIFEMDKPVNGVYTFGQPRVGDREFSRVFNAEIKNRHFRLVNNNDIVTRIPPREFGYSHVGSFQFFDSDGELHTDISWWYEFVESVKGVFKQDFDLTPSFLEAHRIQSYIKKIQNHG